jgi:hypothetical protein
MRPEVSMRSRPCLATFVVLALSLAAQAQAGHRGSSTESLRGIGKVALVIESVETFSRPVDTEADTPSRAQVKAGVEEQLRDGGIQLTEPAAAGGRGEPTPTLHLYLMARKDEKGFNNYVLRLWFTQEVTLPRATPVKVVASTWENTVLSYGAGHMLFERAICGQVHEFIEAYKAANSGSPVSPRSGLIPPMSYNGPCPLERRR